MTAPLILPFNGKTPKIHESAFIAPGCKIIGDVEIGPEASVWYNCVIRADVNFIRIGARSNIQDGTTIHCDSATPATPNGNPTIIGDDVLVGRGRGDPDPEQADSLGSTLGRFPGQIYARPARTGDCGHAHGCRPLCRKCQGAQGGD